MKYESWKDTDRFMNKLRVLSVSLAMSLMMAQTAQATVTITPFGTVQSAQETQAVQSETVGETGAAADVAVGENVGPGFENSASGGTSADSVAQGSSTAQGAQSSQATVGPQATGTSAEAAQAAGPGAAVSVSQVMTPSASYSTKEPVQVTTSQTVTNAGTQVGPGASSQTTSASAVSGPGVVTETTAVSGTETVTVDIAEPEIAAESAILYDVTHDRFLYEKEADTKRYPASITKIMTALLVLENAKLDETVTFSENAVTRLESGAVTLQLQAGDQVSVKDCLYGLLLKSANEVANGLAEHVAGSIYGFADMMNAKATALGCTNTHFVNPNGLNDSDHYTTARDMAKIAKAAFENEKLCEIASTTSYKFPATKAAAARTITMGHKMLYTSDSRYYEGIVGGKTGYTSLAGNTLVTCVERDGVRMIAVILKSRSSHYTDTKALFDYGYELEKAGACAQSVGASNTVDSGAAMGSAYHKWIADGDIWRFELADGTRLSNCFVTIDGADYAFDIEGKMVTGWMTLGTNWHYFANSGAMIKNDWRQDQGLWFYLGADGAMVKNSWIDNKYYVGEDGVWVE